MTYPCTDCIMDMLASSGPQEPVDLRRECHTQAVPYRTDLFDAAIAKLLADGKIVYDDEGYYDFPESYYEAQIN